MRVAYFTNVYPAISHTFIRREIRAIETLGVTVFRYALRPAEIFDPEDKREEEQTRYILRAGAGELFRCCMVMLFTQPLAVGQAIRQAIKVGWSSNRRLLRHFAYLAEAAVLAYWCRRATIQHLHAHFGTNSAAIAMLASQISGIPYSFTAHGSEEFIKAAYLSLNVKLEHASFAVCVSAFGRSQLMLWSRPDQWRKIAIVHCGLDSAFFESPIQPPPPTPRLVCVGRLDENKAQIILVAAARRLRDAGIHCEIVLVGDGDMRHHVEDAIQRAGLQRDVTITGWVSGDRVKAEIAAARALVLPSLSENMPVVIMEALAIGRPVISTYVAGIPELVQPGKTGWLVPAGDEIALAEAMREALAAPVEQLESMGAEGRLHIIKHHDTLKEAVKLKSLFEAGAELSPNLGDGTEQAAAA
jgi:colanic acid/amylovoran biosynthesis glycosyltransferase